MRIEYNPDLLLCSFPIDINTYQLEETNSDLEKYISDITGTSLEANHIARLQGRAIFKVLLISRKKSYFIFIYSINYSN